ncbi:MAG: DUF1735 domain-containing protein [Bacteroidales bacterium]|nr:DUF1735 domain-containing protein [Bacteroidales bacterium]
MKKILGIILILLPCFLAPSCNKEGNGKESGNVAVLSVNVKGADEVIEITKRQSKAFEVNVTANPGPDDALIITLGVNKDLVEKYNSENGTSYELLPAEAYTLPSNSFLLPRYNKVSSLESLTLKGAGCVAGEIYLLPIVASKIEGKATYEMPDQNAAYILFKMLAPDSEGDGSVEDPYVIYKTEDFLKIGNQLIAGSVVYFKLATDIDLDGVEWTPAGGDDIKVFFDGDGHKISNLSASLFSKVEGTIQNLTIENAEVNAGAANAGILAEVAKGEIKNVAIINSKLTNTGTATGTFIGLAEKVTMIGCHASGSCTSKSTGYSRVGGLIGDMREGSVENCYSTVDVEGQGHFGGGLIACAGAENTSISISKSYATGKVYYNGTANKSGYGALVGRMEKGNLTITDSYATGAVKAFRWSGGFVGSVGQGVLSITNGYTTSDISAIGPDNNGNYQRGSVLGYIQTPVSTTIKCKGFIGWKVGEGDFCFPADAVSTSGNYYGAEGTVSSWATKFNWSTAIWDLSGDEPKLK